MSILQPGEIIESRYRIVRLLGEGGMNRVYLAEDLTGTDRWALKVAKDSSEVQTSQQEIYTQFLKEISILTTLRHESLPRVIDYFSDGSRHYVVEELIDGETLESRLRHGNLPTGIVLECALALCDVLELLHRKGIIFRDLKPANVMLTRDGAIKLVDFDIARHYKEGKTGDTELLGTPGYAAPETYGAAQSDARSDVYSLGATIHHLITGIDPGENQLL